MYYNGISSVSLLLFGDASDVDEIERNRARQTKKGEANDYQCSLISLISLAGYRW